MVLFALFQTSSNRSLFWFFLSWLRVWIQVKVPLYSFEVSPDLSSQDTLRIKDFDTLFILHLFL